jgi:hypothetical protein
MAFVAVAASVGAAVGLGGTAAIIGGGALIGAGVGGAYSAITGDGNVLNSMLTGGLIGGAGAYGIGALGGGGAGVQAQMAGPFFGGAATGTGTVGPAATAVKTASPAMSAASNTAPGFAYTPAGEMVSSAYPASVTGAANTAGFVPPSPGGIGAIGKAATEGLTGGEKLALGLGATSLLSLMGSQNQSKLSSDTGTTPSYIRPYTYSSTQNQPGGPYPAPYATVQYDQAGNPVMDTRERDYFTQSFTAGEPYKAANGGLMAAGGPVERMSQMNTAINPQGGMYPQGMIDKTQYALPTQRPTSMEVLDAGAQRMYAAGGEVQRYNLGGYSDGGRLLKGPGDGVSDGIPAVIGNRQPARLADGEFVIPARIVSELGNGSTDAGAKRLYAMMDKIQAGRKKTVGKGNVAKDSKARKHLLA